MLYHHPRLSAVIEQWPSGTHRTTATFRIETTTRGQRGVRTTINPKTGQPSAPKLLTFARRARIVDGDDGRLYILEDNGSHLCVMQSNMKFEHENIWPSHPQYSSLLALFNE